MRTFIALDLSENVKRELSRLRVKLQEVNADVKWINIPNIHLTLKFLGEINDEKVEEIKKAIDMVCASAKTFKISLFKLGAFPSVDSPRVIWTGIDKGCNELENLALTLEDILEKTGIPKEDRQFQAHLTLGRARSSKNRDALKDKLKKLEVKPEACVIDRMVLYRSQLTPKGPIYTVLYEAAFKAA